jgi:hypothetical protein
VCDVNGVTVSSPVISQFLLRGFGPGTLSNEVNELYTAEQATNDQFFRYDGLSQQWMFNLATQQLNANSTYFFRIVLIDGTNIDFQFGLK